MATAAKLGYGAKLLMHDGATAPDSDLAGYVEIGEIVTGPNDSDTVGEIEVTNHQSPGAAKEYIPDLKEYGSINVTCNYIPSDVTQGMISGLQYVFDQRLTRTFWIIPVGEALGTKVSCFVTSRARTLDATSVMQITFDLKKAGAETEEAIPS